jgi:PAT family beta-lactamase induction signal transducer AmpG
MKTRNTYFQKNILGIFFLGYSSGLPIALIGGTLAIWLTRYGIDKTSLGLFSMVMAPYSLKPFWAFVLDTISIPFLSKKFGFRSSWIIVSMILLFVLICALGNTTPKNINLMAVISLAIGFCSANLDIAVDAYRIETVDKNDQAAAAATYSWGYRIAMLVSGGGALYLSEYYPWSLVYTSIGSSIFIGLIALYIIGEPKFDQELFEVNKNDSLSQRFRKLIIAPTKELISQKNILLIFCFIICFKISDSFLGVMANPFYVEMGYSNKEIAIITKAYGLLFTLLGTFSGGLLLSKIGYFHGLLIAGILQAISNLAYILLLYSNHDLNILTLVLAIENTTAALSGVMVIAYLSSLCSIQYSATHYAILSSLALLGKSFLSSPAGYVVTKYNWEYFFYISTLLGLPGIILLFILERKRVFGR